MSTARIVRLTTRGVSPIPETFLRLLSAELVVFAEQVAAIHPTLRVLFTSGYPEDVAIRAEIGEARAHFIDKPYRSAELAEIVQRMLAGAPPE